MFNQKIYDLAYTYLSNGEIEYNRNVLKNLHEHKTNKNNAKNNNDMKKVKCIMDSEYLLKHQILTLRFTNPICLICDNKGENVQMQYCEKLK